MGCIIIFIMVNMHQYPVNICITERLYSRMDNIFMHHMIKDYGFRMDIMTNCMPCYWCERLVRRLTYPNVQFTKWPLQYQILFWKIVYSSEQLVTDVVFGCKEFIFLKDKTSKNTEILSFEDNGHHRFKVLGYKCTRGRMSSYPCKIEMKEATVNLIQEHIGLLPSKVVMVKHVTKAYKQFMKYKDDVVILLDFPNTECAILLNVRECFDSAKLKKPHWLNCDCSNFCICDF